MGERDAFGREKGEDPLEQMGWSASAPRVPPAVKPGDPRAAPPKPDPAATVFAAGEAVAPFARKPRPPEREPAPAPSPPPRPAPLTFTRRRPRSRGPSVAKLLILVAIVGAGFIGVSALVRVGGDAVSGIRGQIEGIKTAPTAPRSLLRPAPLKAALAKLPSGRLVFLRVSAERIDAQVIAGGKRHIVQLRADGGTAGATAGAGPRQASLKANVQAPSRIARTASRRSGRPVADVDYLVLTDTGWLLFFKGGDPHYRASASGRKVTKF